MESNEVAPNQATTIRCGRKELRLGERTLIMGILNVTPDSFSDGGKYVRVEQAVEQAQRMVEEGADIIDIGGESTRPGFQQVSAEEELRRVIPVIEAISSKLDVPISVDTYKAETAKQSLEAGAHIINDIWGFKRDPHMAEVAAAYGCPVILMHNRETEDYVDFLQDVKSDLAESIKIAKRAGVKDEQIILDPGIGFAKSHEQNLHLMNHLYALGEMGYPVLLATSRKRMIRNVLELPVDDVVEGTLATTVIGIMQGCSIIRVHDVKANRRAADMTDAIQRRKKVPFHG
ncbi:dihydropteroate synthase [Marinicrinis lubricantis]|uniref:Dihydropteroate synthase n=1 Tax=Marinicrinis lubricantis TaxID=2086470 RepID=A0ABW1IPR7_9BACL